MKRVFPDILAPKEMKVRREKMAHQEIQVPKGSKGPKGQRVAVVCQVRRAHLDLQDQREKQVPRDYRDILENQEKREIQERQGPEEGTDPRESGEIQARQDHKEAEEVGVHVVSEALLGHLVPQERRGNPASLGYPVTEETQDLQAPRETGVSRESVDQWAYQANQACQDIPGRVERRDLKEKLGHKALQECLVVVVLLERGEHQAQKETVGDRELKGPLEILENRERTVPREKPVNQGSTEKMGRRVNQAYQDQRVLWDRREPLD